MVFRPTSCAFIFAAVASCSSAQNDTQPPATLVFIADREVLDEPGLYTVDPGAGLHPRRKPEARPLPIERAVWSPEGRWLAAWREELVVLDAERSFAVQREGLSGWPVWSHDEMHIALHTTDSEGIVFVSMDGEEQVTVPIVRRGLCAWSDSDHAVLCGVTRDDGGGFEVVHRDGHRVVLDPLLPHGARDMSWSPSGRFVAITAQASPGQHQTWIAPTDGAAAHLAADDVSWIDPPRWLPSATRERLLLLDESKGPVVYDPTAGVAAPLATEHGRYKRRVVGDELAIWNGTGIAFYTWGNELLPLDAHAGRLLELGPRARHLLTLTAEGVVHVDRRRGRTELVDVPATSSVRAFSADGRFLAYLEPHEGGGIGLSVRALEGGTTWPIDTGTATVTGVAWGPDGWLAVMVQNRHIYLAEMDEHGPTAVHLVHAAHSNLRTVDWASWRPPQP